MIPASKDFEGIYFVIKKNTCILLPDNQNLSDCIFQLIDYDQKY